MPSVRFKRRPLSYIYLIAMILVMNLYFNFIIKDDWLIVFGLVVSAFYIIVLIRMFRYPVYISVDNSVITVYSMFTIQKIDMADLKELRIALSPFGSSYFKLANGRNILLLFNEIRKVDIPEFEGIFEGKINYVS